jgi:transcription antitermination factor NusG
MEMRIAIGLQAKKYEVFLPVYKECRRWSDRTKVVERPLFPGYVFCRLAEDSQGLAIRTLGVRRIVGFGGKPCPIDEHEIAALRKVINSQLTVMPWPFTRIGQRVTINAGSLAGVTGLLSKVKSGQRLVVSVDILMRSVAVDIDAKFLTSVADEPGPHALPITRLHASHI